MFLTLIFATTVFAGPLAWLPQSLSPRVGAVACMDVAEADDLKADCAKALCGLPGTNPTIFVESGALDGYTAPADLETEIQRVERDMERATSQWKSEVENFLNAQLSALNAGPDVLPVETMSGIEDLFAPYISYRVENNRIKVVTQFPEGTSSVMQKGVREWARNREAVVQADPAVRLSLGLDSSEEAVASLKARFEKLLVAIDSPFAPQQVAQAKQYLLQVGPALNRLNPPYEFIAGISEYLGRFENGLGIASPGSVTPIGTGPIANGHEYDVACGPDCLNALRPLATKGAMRERIEKIRKRLEEDRPALMRGCRAGLMLQAKYGQMPNQLQIAQGLVETALSKIEKSPWMSEHTAKEFGAFIRNNVDIEPEYPSRVLTGPQFLEAFSQMATQRLQTAPFGGVEANAGVLIDLSETAGNLYGRDFRGCPSPRHLATDFFWQGIEKPLIHVSPHSCRHNAQGVGTLAHELGHALAFFMSESGKVSSESARTYLARRQCVVGLSPLLPLKMPEGAQQMFAGDRLTTEEDMADWVMQQAVPFEEYPLTCDFLKLNDAGDDYDPIMFDITPKADDSHSGGLMRIIREWQAKHNSLPGACQQIMNAHLGIVEARRCE